VSTKRKIQQEIRGRSYGQQIHMRKSATNQN
jgi:hypothetical protein